MLSDKKICTKCNLLKSFDEFHKRTASKDGLSHKCKDCFKSYELDYREKNKEKIKLRDKKYYENNKLKIKEYHKKYYEKNKQKFIELFVSNYKKNKEKILKKRAENKEFFNKKSNEYYHKNKEKCAKTHKEWKKRNRARLTAKQNERYASKNKRTPSWLTEEDKKEITMFYEIAAEMSVKTGIKHHVDHIIPLNGETVSGLHVPQNLQVIDYIQNIRKKNKYDGWSDYAE